MKYSLAYLKIRNYTVEISVKLVMWSEDVEVGQIILDYTSIYNNGTYRFLCIGSHIKIIIKLLLSNIDQIDPNVV